MDNLNAVGHRQRVIGRGVQPLTIPGTARIPAARLWVLGLSVVYAASAAGLILLVPSPHVRLAVSGLVTLGLGAYVPLSRLLHRRPIVVTVEGRHLKLAHFGTARLHRVVPMGDWFDRYSGVGLGTVIHVRTDKGRVVRVGGRGLRTPTALRTVPATRSVEITVSAADLRRLLSMLDMDVAEADQLAGVRVTLFNRINRGRSGCLRLVLPILVLYAVGLIGGGAIFLVQRWWRPGANAAMAASFGFAAVLVVAIVITIWIAQTRRPSPALTLEFEPRGCTVRDRKGRPIAAGPPRWRRLRYPYQDLQGRMCACPVVELVVPSHRPFTLGLLEPEHAWLDRVPATSMPRYLVGPSDWPPLLAALHRFIEDRPT
jgi:hypothetical protein